MTANRVYMLPTPTQAAKDTTNAIHQIVLQLQKHLAEFGWEITENEAEADLFAGHAGQTYSDRSVDVAHCHGLYPTAINPEPQWHWAANASVIKNLKEAVAITVPSQWVADLIRRDMCVEPYVVPWAIPSNWKKAKHPKGYVLWNKTRQDGVCDPTPLLKLAEKNPDIPFITTFGEGGDNVDTIGRQPYEKMRGLVAGAAVYLATTKETFGIGTLEAMACGIPILGYNWGGTANIVEHGVTGYLVEPGDIDGLSEGLRWCIENRKVVGNNGADVAATYRWNNTAQQFAEVYDHALAKKQLPPPHYKVSVVIPCHNYEHFVGSALYSVLGQNYDSFTVSVVFDRCTDNSEAEVKKAYEQFRSEHTQVPPLRTYTVDYGGPAKTRNHGIWVDHYRSDTLPSDYVVCLDADDMLGHPDYLSTLATYLDEHRGTGIVFTGLQSIDVHNEHLRGNTWPNGFDFDQQVRGNNQVPTCCMFRREAWRRAGGYRDYCEPAEDAELWLRIGALGWDAHQVTNAAWFLYRMHDQSLSHDVRIQRAPQPDWRFFHAWTKTGKRPFASIGTPRLHSWPVRNYDKPLVSVIIPVGPAHKHLVQQALDSVYGQTETNWECIVVNDSGQPLDLSAHPWARVIDIGTGNGAGYARNRGVEHATAPLIAYLDADDMWYNNFLEETLKAYRRTGRYVYTDWASLNKDKVVEAHRTPDFVMGDVFQRTSTHSIAVLMEKQWHFEVEGFDEQMVAWEDTDYFMRLQAIGICAVRVPRPLLFYRYTTGLRREIGETVKDELKDMLYNRFKQWIEDADMCQCRENQKRARDVDIQSLNGELVRIEYNGPQARHQVRGLITKENYGRRQAGDVFFVHADDVKAAPNAFVPILDPLEGIPETPVPPEAKRVVV